MSKTKPELLGFVSAIVKHGVSQSANDSRAAAGQVRAIMAPFLNVLQQIFKLGTEN